MRLPDVLKELILDFYWSHKIYMCRQRIHTELQKVHVRNEMRLFYSIFNTITVQLLLDNNNEEIE